MADSVSNRGWATTSKDDPSVQALRTHLLENNGVKGLEIVGAQDIQQASALFRRDGYVIVADVLNGEQTEFLAQGCDQVVSEIIALDTDHKGNRGPHRYSFGGSSLTRSQLHRAEWQMLLDLPVVHQLVSNIFGSAEYCLRVARRMSLMALSPPVCRVCDFCLIFVPFGHYDEPEILPYTISLICSIGADGRQLVAFP